MLAQFGMRQSILLPQSVQYAMLPAIQAQLI
jgi:hypothetical protein